MKFIPTLVSGSVVERRTQMYTINPEKAFAKLAQKQFPDPFDTMRELLANAIDSYGDIEDTQKKVVVHFGSDYFSVTDFGAGMDVEALLALRTLGLSCKKGKDLIGRFGIGFASLFHPALCVERVYVETTKGDSHFNFRFNVVAAGKKVSLDEFLIHGTSPFSTRVAVKLDARLDYESVIYELENRVNNAAKYLPSPVLVEIENDLPYEVLTLPNYGVDSYELAQSIESPHVAGFANISYGNDSKILLLSKNLPVCSVDYSKINPIRANSLSKLKNFSIGGVVNCNTLSPVSSRNELQEDKVWREVAHEISKSVDQCIVKLATKYMKSPIAKDRTILHSLIVACENESNLLTHFQHDTAHYKKLLRQNIHYSALIQVPVFQFWLDTRLYSLADIKSLIKTEQLVPIYTSLEQVVDIVRGSCFGPVKILKSSGSESGDESVLRRIFYKSFGAFNIDDLVTMDRDTIGYLVKHNILQPGGFRRNFASVSEDEISENSHAFLGILRSYLAMPEVGDLFEKHGISRVVGIDFCHGPTESTMACYDPELKMICLNVDNSSLRNYLTRDPVVSAQAFIPILGHEVSHDVAIGHDNPFYELNSVIGMGLRQIIARKVITSNRIV